MANRWGITKNCNRSHSRGGPAIYPLKTIFLEFFWGSAWAIIALSIDSNQLIKSDTAYLVQLEKSFRMLLSTSHMVEPVLRKSTKSKKHKKIKILFIIIKSYRKLDIFGLKNLIYIGGTSQTEQYN